MNHEGTHENPKEALVSPFEDELVQSPVTEFRLFCKGRLGGLELTEDEGSLEAYRQAFDLGLRILKGEVEEEEERAES